ncbi:neuropeptides capa receptor [Anabrus simplex]|uniref:neuropeptides capa receptor n=1 Tax=Anabrus simplex TaxID=316456 RepID=UPI0035A3A760
MNVSEFNTSLETYLLMMRGPKHLPMQVVLPITIVYALIFVTGIVGNIAVCAVIVRTSDMHTATNYYLFSLAISDLALLLLGLPNDLSVFWQQYPWVLGETLCKFRAVVSEMMSYTSVLTIVAFSMERYLAICHPLYSYSMKGLRRALRIIAVVWLVSLASAVPFAAYTTVNYIDYPPGSGNIVAESAFCAMLDENVPSHYPVYELSSLVFFLIPMLVMVVLYVRMGLTIWRPRGVGKRVEGSIHRKLKHNQSRKSIIRMLAAVVIAFFLCWAPFHLQRLLYMYARDSPNFPEINEWMYYIAGCFYYFSSTVNPILYNVMSAKYRDAFFRTLCCMHPKLRRGVPGDTSSFQETTLGYTTSMYVHSRSSPRYSRYAMYREGELVTTDEDTDKTEIYSALVLPENTHSDQLVVTADEKATPRTWSRAIFTDSPTELSRSDEENSCMLTPSKGGRSNVLVVTNNGKVTSKPWTKTVLLDSRTDLNRSDEESEFAKLCNSKNHQQETCI